jgi:hypothetical protein
MPRIEDTLWCDGCGVEILGASIKVNEKHYCCKDCSEGRECDCAEQIESEFGPHKSGSDVVKDSIFYT